MPKPSLFIGSSKEGLDFARAVRSLLDEDAEVTLWNEGPFALGATFIESLVEALPRFDFAALVLTPDEPLLSRDDQVFSPRDNVIFELGLFMGRLGRERTFVVRPRDNVLKIPSDLAGVIVATYEWPRTDNNYRAALGPPCDRMREVILSLGFSPTKVLAHVHAVEEEQARQRKDIGILKLDVFSMSSEIYKHLWHIHHGRLQVEGRLPGSEYREYLYHENEQMHREMYFLKDRGFLQPVSGGDLYFSGALDGKNLVDIVKPTDIASFYVELRKEYERNASQKSA